MTNNLLMAAGLKELSELIATGRRCELLLFGQDGALLVEPLRVDPPGRGDPATVLVTGIHAMLGAGQDAEAALVCESAWAFVLIDHLNPMGATAGGIFRSHRQAAWNQAIAPRFNLKPWEPGQAAPGPEDPRDPAGPAPAGPWYAPPPPDDNEELFPADFGGTPAQLD